MLGNLLNPSTKVPKKGLLMLGTRTPIILDDRRRIRTTGVEIRHITILVTQLKDLVLGLLAETLTLAI
ncbi:MAG: hypothetical protein ACLSH6_03385 [Limosilactobacillus pontis]